MKTDSGGGRIDCLRDNEVAWGGFWASFKWMDTSFLVLLSHCIVLWSSLEVLSLQSSYFPIWRSTLMEIHQILALQLMVETSVKEGDVSSERGSYIWLLAIWIHNAACIDIRLEGHALCGSNLPVEGCCWWARVWCVQEVSITSSTNMKRGRGKNTQWGYKYLSICTLTKTDCAILSLYSRQGSL